VHNVSVCGEFSHHSCNSRCYANSYKGFLREKNGRKLPYFEEKLFEFAIFSRSSN